MIYNLILETRISFAFFSLGPTTAKDYLKAGISAKFQPFRNMQYKNKYIG